MSSPPTSRCRRSASRRVSDDPHAHRGSRHRAGAAHATDATAESRTFYGADGKVLGGSITDSDGVTTYYDAAGRITGRTSTGGDTMTIYGADGRVVVTVTKPRQMT